MIVLISGAAVNVAFKKKINAPFFSSSWVQLLHDNVYKWICSKCGFCSVHEYSLHKMAMLISGTAMNVAFLLSAAFT